MKQKTILITNDDGITANGIRALVEVMQAFGRVVVVAPDKPQSAMGHAITITKPLRLTKVDVFGGVEAYACSGTPVDCVKLAVDKVLKQKPDLCVSGINHGPNSSINVIYSGTMSAAMEASLEDIKAVGFSLLNFTSTADMSHAKRVVRDIIENVLYKGMASCNLLNVNIPDIPYEEIKGIKICRQGEAHWKESYDERTDPFGRKYYWLTGKFTVTDQGEDTDEWALKNGYVSVVPTQHDLTNYKDVDFLKEKWV
ncbi:MAG: 5'/3'-nucleotidase SurE [Chitinophagales bacterium]